MPFITRVPVATLALEVTEVAQADGSFVLAVTNPDPLTGLLLPGATGTGVSLSIQPNGDLTCTPAGSAGAYERCTKTTQGFYAYWPGQARLGPPANFANVYLFAAATPPVV
jgi:hypothetical protein